MKALFSDVSEMTGGGALTALHRPNERRHLIGRYDRREQSVTLQ
jgi:hypothetical protein